MVYLHAQDIAKRFGERFLFKSINLTVNKGAKIGLIAKNGSGKTTLLQIVTGQESEDEGQVTIDKNINWAYLKQNPEINETLSVWDNIFNADNELFKAVASYELALNNLESNPNDANMQNELQRIIELIDKHNAWDIEAKIKTVLTKLNLQHHLNHLAKNLSGGQVKRLALAKILLQEPDFIIMDEPTNHLDIPMIEWLEGYLKSSDITLLLVTHDRYFLDAVCNQIVELTPNTLYHHFNGYAKYLEDKALREEIEATEIHKAQRLAKKELEWMRRQPKARTTKSKSRIEAFYKLEEKAKQKPVDKSVEIKLGMSRLGKKILELSNIQKSFGSKQIISNFSYVFKPGERIGVVGENGMGKSTFLNLIQGIEPIDGGNIEKGDTIKFGYYSQAGLQNYDHKRVIEVITDIADYIEIGRGEKLTATALLTLFLFEPKKQHAFVSTLSGGEKRRLFLLTILMKQPNFLILDEPTNDLDIDTLNVLEEFLEKYEGCLLVVTHDRYFMDTLVDSLLVFEGEGYLRSFNGNYQDYLNEKEEDTLLLKQKQKGNDKVDLVQPKLNKKPSFKEKHEFETLGKEIEALQNQRNALEQLLSSGSSNHSELSQWSNEIKEITKQLDEKELRWLELSEMF